MNQRLDEFSSYPLVMRSRGTGECERREERNRERREHVRKKLNVSP